MNTVIFDMDGTLSLVGDRLNFLEQKNWDAFYNAVDEDLPNERIIHIYNLFKGHKRVVLTGRVESVREKTLMWFEKFGVEAPDLLLMRKDGDRRPDTITKPRLLEKSGIVKEDVVAIFEDRASVVAKWRELGFTVLQVSEGNF